MVTLASIHVPDVGEPKESPMFISPSSCSSLVPLSVFQARTSITSSSLLWFCGLWLGPGIPHLPTLFQVIANYPNGHPLTTPFSPTALQLYLGLSDTVIQVLSCKELLHGLRNDIKERHHYCKGITEGTWRAIEETASKSSSKTDALVLEQSFLSLDEDHAPERLLEAIPGVCKTAIHP